MLVPAGESAEFGGTLVLQAASETQPRVELWLTNDFQIQPYAEMTVPSGGYTNDNAIELGGGNAGITGSDPLTNTRLIEGGGSIQTTVLNQTGGNISVSVAQHLTIAGSENTNDGDLSVVGGTLHYTQDLANHAGGRINAINAELSFDGGLTNLGELNLINSTVNGTVNSSSAVALSGSNTFSGAVSGPGNFTGDGAVEFDGSYAPAPARPR